MGVPMPIKPIIINNDNNIIYKISEFVSYKIITIQLP